MSCAANLAAKVVPFCMESGHRLIAALLLPTEELRHRPWCSLEESHVSIASCLLRAGRLALVLGAAASLLPLASPSHAKQATPGDARLTLDTEAVAPLRFIAAHGRRALVDGYAADGLEVWAYPFQILSGYRVAFRPSGATTPIRGQDVLSRVTYEPNAVTRTYLAPDFIVRERLFVPLDEPGAILTYQVEGGHGVEIEVHATPVLDLMWPGALGGQGAGWDASLSAFVLSEPADGYSAVVGSPQIAAHDELANRTASGEGPSPLGFTLRPDSSGVARVYIALNPPHAADTGSLFRQLIRDRQALETASAAHVSEFLAGAMRVETPDPQVNEAIAWSEIALDQAWVCNPDLGCGFVAGYGPSRGPRRPQYDWFFAGDGLVAAEGALASSDNARVRQELGFILRYQDRKTGMIWHELSQSAGLIDWTGEFPYMFVHVDITFQFLPTLEHYVTASGDTAFLREHWEAIEAAYRYCRSTIDPATKLPRIPADKSGGDEQDRVADDLGLSTGWVQAASAFAHLASLTGHADLAEEAARAGQLAATAIPARYWSARQSFWVSGHTSAGQDAPEQRSSPGEALAMHLFSPEQNAIVLDKLASSSFQTDWGTRGVGAGSPGYDPASYAKGSVWAVNTASLAQAFWSEHRPATAQGLWRALLPWTRLDSFGHMDEVLAGTVYRPQTESVPEQTWSSAGFLGATIHGLLGLNVDAVANHIAFAPHLPAAWNCLSIDHIKLSDASLSLELRRTSHGITLTIDNPGAPFKLEFAPEIPLGARVISALLDLRPITADLEAHPQETDARVAFDAPHGKSELHIDWQGGVSVIAASPAPLKGMPSTGVRIVGVHLDGDLLTIAADVPRDRASHIQLQTEWGIAKVEGAGAWTVSDGLIDLTFAAVPDAASSEPYRPARAIVQFKR
jgi:glycogen debranching enzyme